VTGVGVDRSSLRCRADFVAPAMQQVEQQQHAVAAADIAPNSGPTPPAKRQRTDTSSGAQDCAPVGSEETYADEAKRSTVAAALPCFRREFPDFSEWDAKAALEQCFREEITVSTCGSSRSVASHAALVSVICAVSRV
jgi:hypothetical protein